MRGTILLSSLALFSLPPLASADTVNASYTGMYYGAGVQLLANGTYHHTTAGEMKLLVDGAYTPAFCVDLDHYVYSGRTYTANLVPVTMTDYWCEVNYILENYEATSNAEAAAMQIAIWSLIYDVTLYPGYEAYGAAADAILADSDGSCPLTCDEVMNVDVAFQGWSDGYLYATGGLYRTDGSGISGEEITLTLTDGVLVEPADGVVVTDADGAFEAVIDPAGATGTTLTADAFAQNLLKVDPVDPYQELISFIYGDPCTYTDADSFTELAFGDPRTIGFWKHQAKVAWTGAGGSPQVEAATLESWLPITIFDHEVTSLEEMYNTLWVTGKDKQAQAWQQCLATWLNYEYDQYGWFTGIDYDADGTNDGHLFEFWQEAAGYYSAGEFESAKTVCDTINNL